MMENKYLVALVVFLIASVTSACGATYTFTINLDNPPNGPSITGAGWDYPCVENGNTCSDYCAGSSGADLGDWEEGYYFDSDIVGSAVCTLTLRATAFDVTNATGPGATDEIIEAQVNDVIFEATRDICTGVDLDCACDVATKVSTKTVNLAPANNHITVRKPGDNVAIAGATLTCTGEVTECDPGYNDNYQCSGNWLQRGYVTYDCSTEWRNYEYCSYGCSGGSCRPYANSYCTDTDHGAVYSTQGNTYGVNGGSSYSKNDYCVGNTLNEYYCNGTMWNVVTTTCSYGCRDGRCISSACSNDCVYGERECDGHDGYRICGYYDSDVCTEWKAYECDGDETCDDGYCEVDDGSDDDDDDDNDDDCDAGYENEYRCDGSWRQRLYVYSDCDEEWRDYQYCSDGCSDDECNGDDDDADCDAGYTSQYRCSGNWRQRKYVASDCDEFWMDYTLCSYGCSGTTCNSGPGNYCGNGVCNSGETTSNCPQDCGTCGNGVCNSGETSTSCPQDCSTCGNGVCGSGETSANCPQDCGIPVVCGDRACSGSETSTSCPQDCGGYSCGDGVCNGVEDCHSCAQDCSICTVCGDGLCTGSERCGTCISDCGECVDPEHVEIADNVTVDGSTLIEFKGFGTGKLNLTIRNPEDHSVVYQIDIEGEAADWADVQSPSVRVPEYGTGVFAVTVTVPQDTATGVYNMTLKIKSGGRLLLERPLYVKVSPPEQQGGQPVVAVQRTPTGAFIIGGVSVVWALVGVAVLINLALVALLVKKLRA